MEAAELVIGLVGKNGSGKSQASAYLSSKGFQVLSLSDIVRSETKKKGQALTRENLTQCGNELKEKFGLDYLAKESYKNCDLTKNPHVVFDSIRNATEANYLAEHGVILIGIRAPVELRYQRIKSRGNVRDDVSFEQFKAQDEVENSGRSYGQNIAETIKHCEKIIENLGSVDDLHQILDTMLKEMLIDA